VLLKTAAECVQLGIPCHRIIPSSWWPV
jgi:hypothetical protein